MNDILFSVKDLINGLHVRIALRTFKQLLKFEYAKVVYIVIVLFDVLRSQRPIDFSKRNEIHGVKAGMELRFTW